MRFFYKRLGDIYPHHNSDMKTLGDRVKERREQMGMTQKQLAARAGLRQNTISDLERGRNDGSRHLVALAVALKTTAEWLTDGTTDGANPLPPAVKEDPPPFLTFEESRAIELFRQLTRSQRIEFFAWAEKTTTTNREILDQLTGR